MCRIAPQTFIDFSRLSQLAPCHKILQMTAVRSRSHILRFLRDEELPCEETQARKVALQALLFTVDQNILYYLDPKQKYQKRVAIPEHLKSKCLRRVIPVVTFLGNGPTLFWYVVGGGMVCMLTHYTSLC